MKSAIVTGASRGIGAATARLLYKEYEYLALVARNRDGALERLLLDWGELEGGVAPCEVGIFSGDVGDFEFCHEVVDAVAKRCGSVDLLVNNAGVSYVGLITDMGAADWDDIVRSNLTSVFNMCHAAVPYMVREKKGRIINVSSVWGLVGASCEVAYSATKGGVNGFTMALAKELGPSGVAVNGVAFGAVDTGMNSHLTEEEKEELAGDIPVGRFITPEEAAAEILHLSKAPLYQTGDILKFDGAWI